MRRTLLILLGVILAICAPAEDYKVVKTARFFNKITPKAKTTSTPLKEGDILSEGALLEVPSGALVKLQGMTSKKNFESVSSGRMTVKDFVDKAIKRAKDQGSTVSGPFTGGQKSQQPKRTVYVRKGASMRNMAQMDGAENEEEVRPSEAALDDEANDIWTNSSLLGHIMASRVVRGDSLLTSATPLDIKSLRDASTGLGFSIDNTLDCPVYVNVVRVKQKDGKWSAGISRVGQPVCCYVILPGQTLLRSQRKPAGEGERNMVVVMPYLYDIDVVIDQMNETFSNPECAEDFSEIPLLIDEI